MTISQKLKEAREIAGISLTGLSKRTGVSRSSLQRYEKGATEKIPLSAVSAIEKALGLTSGYLMGWIDEKDKHKTENKPLTENQKEIVSIFEKLTIEKQNKVIGFASALLPDETDIPYKLVAFGGANEESQPPIEQITT